MQQIYTAYTSTTADVWQDIVFRAPVRKAMFCADGAVNMRIPGSRVGVTSQYLRLYKETPVYLDFQTANSGCGINKVQVRAVDGTQQYVRISVSEYGTNGNNDYYL